MKMAAALCALLFAAPAFAQGSLQLRQYGPFTGYVSSVPRHAAPLGSITSGSLNFLFDPTERKMVRRKGTAGFDSMSTLNAAADSATIVFRPRARKIMQLSPYDVEPANANVRFVYPTVAALYTDEAYLSKPAGSVGKMGTVYVYGGASAGTNYTLGSEFPATWNGRTAVWSGVKNNNSNETIYTALYSDVAGPFRPNSRWSQLQLAAGSRGMLESGNWLYLPNAHCTPAMWNKSFNFDSAGTNSYISRLRPWGQYPPLFAPMVTDSGAPRSITAKRSWTQGDKFYISVLFKFEDGSYGPPIIPDLTATEGGIGPSTKGARGGVSGFVQLSDSSATDIEYFDYINWLHIPIGPHGTVARVLLRTPKVTQGNGAPSFRDLRITAIIPNNTQTRYQDPNGDDNALIVNDEIVRFDHVWPQRAQYVFGNDARVVIGGAMRPNPAAIILAPTGVSASRDLNGSSAGVGYRDVDNVTPLTANVCFGVYTKVDSLVLVKNDAGVYSLSTFAFSAYPTIRQLVKAINSTTFGSGAGEWAAQVAPGADDATASGDLAATGYSSTFGDSLRFGIAATPQRNGIMWIRSPSWPGVLYYSSAWSSQWKYDHQSIYFTGASPGHAQSVPNNFYVGNRRSPPNRAVGKFMGGAACKDRFVIAYENAIYVLANRKGGTTGEDQDYRLFPLNETRGCVAWSSIVSGDGWVGYMTRDGYVVTDTEQEVMISQDVYDAQRATGDWVYEMAQSIASSSITDPAVDSVSTYFHAAAIGSKIHINYRSSSGSSQVCDRRLIYDYSAGSASSGLSEVTNNGKPWGWSAPLGDNVSAMGVAQVDASGPYTFGAVELKAFSVYSNAGVSNKKIRIDKFDSGTSGNAADSARIYCATDFAETMQLKSAEQIYAIYNKSAGVTPYVNLFLNGVRTTPYQSTLAINSTGAPYTRTVRDLPTAAKSSAESYELLITDYGSATSPLEVWTIALRYRVLDSVR